MCPQLILVASQYGVRMALLNASLSGDDLLMWHSYKTYRRLLTRMLTKFDLIVPQSDIVSGDHDRKTGSLHAGF